MRSRYAAYAVGLAVAWVMLWDRLSLANFVGGLLVATVILVVFPLHRTAPDKRRIVNVAALARLAGHVLRDVISSNLLVARQIVSRRYDVNTGIVACRMRAASPKLLSTVANVIALSPGTMAVDAIADPPTLYVHVLAADDMAEIRRRVAHLEMLVIRALGSATDRSALARSVAEGSSV